MPRAAKTKDHRVGSMSSQVPVWFWRRMSRLMADQENRGGNNGNPDPDEEDSIMGVNLAEGYRTVNATPRRVEREARDRRERRDLKFEVLGSKVKNPRISDLDPSRLARLASLARLARLSR